MCTTVDALVVVIPDPRDRADNGHNKGERSDAASSNDGGVRAAVLGNDVDELEHQPCER